MTDNAEGERNTTTFFPVSIDLFAPFINLRSGCSSP